MNNLKFSHLKAGSEIEQICLVVTAVFLGKVFVCLLDSVSVRPTEVGLPSIGQVRMV